MTFRCHFLTTKYPLPWPFANWTAKPSRPNKSLFKPHLGSQTKSLINRGWSLMRRHSLFFFFFFFGFRRSQTASRISSGCKQCMCVCVCVFWKSAIPLTNEGCWFLFSSGLFLEAAISTLQLKSFPEEKGLGNNLRKRIVWPQHFGWLKIHSAQLWQSISLFLSFSLSLSLSLLLIFFALVCGLASVICSTQNQQKPQSLDWPYMWKSIQRNVALLLIKPGLCIYECIYECVSLLFFFFLYRRPELEIWFHIRSKFSQWSCFTRRSSAAHGSAFITDFWPD